MSNFCPECGVELENPSAIACPNCGGAISGGSRISMQTQYGKRKSPVLAAILSFFFGGLGQIYNGQIGKGIMIMIAVIMLCIVDIICLLLFGFGILLILFIIHIILGVTIVYDAYSTAEMINRGELV
jgi:TM2 domain-containing membrane protein YozV